MRNSDWIGLDLFNDDTRRSGHISRPTQVNVSQSCFFSRNSDSFHVGFRIDKRDITS